MGDTDPDSFRASFAATVAAHRLPAFVALTLSISWGVWVPLFVTVPDASILLAVPGAFGPALAGAVVVRCRGDGVRAWLRDCLAWRVPPRWYAAALGLPVAVGLVVAAGLLAARPDASAGRLLGVLPLFPLALLFTTLLGGGQEEFGWRGVALPALRERVGDLTASVAIGVVWAAWHLPLFAFDVGGYGGQSFLLYVPLVVGLSVLFTWLHEGTGSVLLAMLFHGGWNTAPNLPAAVLGGSGRTLYLGLLAVVWLLALAVVAYHGPGRFGAGGDADAGAVEESVARTAGEVSR
ncbi:CPBP family intramembrane glutamic endopeptidase [Haloarcula litorea]|uniref:CPBP family intramembrane glutamic endopeptidase n=1 Tax=Haloarcula litorea TaxID=3032579 RepID=UPI0023E898AF|nr:type II CAAX endopeptidase family protein [Halomicroarcula sp. GDY20]